MTNPSARKKRRRKFTIVLSAPDTVDTVADVRLAAVEPQRADPSAAIPHSRPMWTVDHVTVNGPIGEPKS